MTRGGWWVIGQAALLVAAFITPLLTRRSLPWPDSLVEPLRFAGGSVIALGLALGIAGAVTLGPNLTPLPKPGQTAFLVRRGIYELVRHPIYGGVILVLVGWALAAPSWTALPLAILGFFFFDRKATREEAWLRERFPDYDIDMAGRQKLIPFLY